MGIPIDGSKYTMLRNLKEKGFVSSSTNNKDILEGKFNGANVVLQVGTNGTKVYRIMVAYTTLRNEADIKIQFNNLCHQFASSEKYIAGSTYIIPEDEDISVGMKLYSKRYEAQYHQLPTDPVALATLEEKAKAFLLSRYTKDQIANPSEETSKAIFKDMTAFIELQCANRSVWFMINEFEGEYFISMYYDNVKNKANGEDL